MTDFVTGQLTEEEAKAAAIERARREAINLKRGRPKKEEGDR
jgi:hypothetical protein